jgi:hypothetical protein
LGEDVFAEVPHRHTGPRMAGEHGEAARRVHARTACMSSCSLFPNGFVFISDTIELF